MTQRSDSDAGGKVDIFPILKVIEMHALGFGEDGGGARVCSHHVRGLGRDNGLGGGVGGGVSIGDKRCSLT